MFVQMAEKDILKFTRAARNQEYLLKFWTVSEKQNRNMDLQLGNTA